MNNLFNPEGFRFALFIFPWIMCLAIYMIKKRKPVLVWTNTEANRAKWLSPPEYLTTSVSYAGEQFIPIAVVMMPDGELKTIYIFGGKQ